MKTRTVFCILVFCIAGRLFAQDALPVSGGNPNAVDETSLAIDNPETPAEEINDQIGVFTAWDFVRMVLILGAVIGVIYLVFFLLKRSGSPKIRENRLIRVLSSKVIANGKAVHLVEVGNQVFLLGAAENSLSLLSEISDKETLDGIRLQAATAMEGERKSFGEVLGQMFGKERNPIENGTRPDPVGFIQEQRKRLKQI